MRPPRLAIVVSHPIQHFVPLYRALAARGGLALKVFYASSLGVTPYYDREMATTIQWAGDPLAGYASALLPGHERIKRSGFFSIDNPGLGRVLAAFKPDAVMLYGYAQMTQLRAFAWCRRRGIPILMTGDGDNRPRPAGLRSSMRTFVLRRLLRRVAAFLTVGDQNEAMLAGLGVSPSRMFRTPLTIDETLYLAHAARRAAERTRLRTQLGIAEDATVLIVVGKLSGRKRPHDVVAAWTRLDAGLRDRHRILLLFCGDGPARPALAQAIAAAGAPARLAGFVNIDDLPAYFCAADILVHPSAHDPHPLTCSEAASIGLPMILSDRVGAIGPSDIAREGQNALVYRCGDVDALAAAIARLGADADLRRGMAANAREIFAACDMQATIGGFECALRSVLGRPAAA